MNKYLLTLLMMLLSLPAWAQFNGSGTFNLPYDWEEDEANNIPIQADRMQGQDQAIATGLSTCITKNGQTTVTANLPMGGFRHTGVGDATAQANYASAGQVQANSLCTAADTGSANALTIAPMVAAVSYTTGQIFWVRAAASNTASTSLNVSSLGTRFIKKNGNSDLEAGDILAGNVYGFYYNAVSGTFQPITPLGTQLTTTPTAIANGTNSVTAAAQGISASIGGIQMISLTTGGLAVSGTVSGTGIAMFGGLLSSGDITATGRTLAQAALISTSVNGTVSGTYGYYRYLSATTLALGSATATSPSIIAAFGSVGGFSGCSVNAGSFNLSTCARLAAGRYGISFTTVLAHANYTVVCMPQTVGGAAMWGVLDHTISPTTAGFVVTSQGTASPQDTSKMMCQVFIN